MSKLSLGVERVAHSAQSGAPLAQLARAESALAEAITATDAVRLVATAKALDEWARAVRAGEDHERQAAVFVLRAKRNAGQRIAEAQARGEVARPGASVKGLPNVGGDDIRGVTLPQLGVSRDESSEWKKLAAEWTDDALTAAAGEMERPSLAGIQQRSPGMFSSASPEWYTPRHVVEAVVEAMDGIDLDPCAEPARAVPAAQHFTATDDGLGRPWHGRVYMNPPYGREIGAWVDKLADEYEAGRVTEAIALVPSRTDTSWWAHLPAAMVCFVTGRLAFSDHENPAPFPSAVAYLGQNPERFATAFLPLGLVYVRLETEAAA